MIIGIDASRAFQKSKTGIEEYSYHVVEHLRDKLEDAQVVLYLNPGINADPDFDLPRNWKIKKLRAPIFWTQIRLSLELLLHPIDVLFIPAHTVPMIHPHKTLVTIHGLEYEFCPKAYSAWQNFYMCFVIKNSCKWAKKIIAVSNNTKLDLIELYKVPEEKIKVIYEGIGDIISKSEFLISNQIPNPKSQILDKYKVLDTRYLLFIGRLEERKNICGIVEAFEILKKRYNLPHKLVLAGKFGYGEEKIKDKIENSEYKDDIILPGYVSEEEKLQLLENAEAFLFPSFYEGFGLPILEAQSVGLPVVTSNISSMPEVAGDSEILADPKDPDAIAKAVYELISDEVHKNDIIKKGLENVKRFSWERCAEEISKVISNL